MIFSQRRLFLYTPGSAISGIVEAAGVDAANFRKGDRVLGNVDGAFAEYGLAKADEWVPIPENLSSVR